MIDQQFLSDLCEAMEIDAAEVKPELEIDWDSLRVVSCVSLFDEHLGWTPDGKSLRSCNTIGDLLKLAEKEMRPA